MSRRALLGWIGKTAGAGAMYQAMSSLGFAAESTKPGTLKLSGTKKGASPEPDSQALRRPARQVQRYCLSRRARYCQCLLR